MLAQGDVLLIKEGAMPSGVLEAVPDGVVARGEATGHAHRLGMKARLYRLAPSMELWVDAREGGSLTHEEHGALDLKGLYRVVIQREYDGAYSRLVTD